MATNAKPAAKTAPAKPAAKTTTAVAEVKKTASAVVPAGDMPNFAEDAGRGMEGTTSDSFAIPFLTVLQKGSPQVDEASGVAIDGAKQGMLYNTVTKEMYDGKDEGMLLVPAAYKRVFLAWAPRDQGGGFKGEFTPEAIARMREEGKIVEQEGQLYQPLPDGSVNEKKCIKYRDTRNHYCVMVPDNGEGDPQEVLLSLTSTQIKKSKGLMSALANIKFDGAQGRFTPPTFANMVRMKTVPESNDKGNWMGSVYEIESRVTRPDVYALAKKFHQSVARGIVTADYEAAEETMGSGDQPRRAAGGEDGAAF